MSKMNLIVNITCNPPQISIFGPISETTIDELKEVLPNSCSTTNTDKYPVAFVLKEDPPHWYGELRGQFANEKIGTSHLFVALLDALEKHESAWKLCGSMAMTHDDDKCTYKFFFSRGAS